MTESTIEESGYVLDRVYFARQQFDGVSDPNEFKSGDQTPVTIAWDWRILAAQAFEVMVRLATEPVAARPERMEVLVVGRFHLQGPPPGLSFHRFVRVGAPTILVPYAREAMSSLSARGAIGPFFLSPMNVTTLDNFDMALTIAAQQLRENPALGEAFGDLGLSSLALPPAEGVR